MTSNDRRTVELCVAAFAHPRTPGRIATLVKAGGFAALEKNYAELPAAVRADVAAEAERLFASGVKAAVFGVKPYPGTLADLRTSIPILFYRGNPELLQTPGIGMCGSRSASETGLRAAAACGDEVARAGFAVVSGYAKGVDMATHLAALRRGGRTVVVLAEGIERFRVKREIPRELFTDENVLVVSQFAPRQPWSAGAAMTRNHTIFGMAQALVVVEAGDKGGTLAAGTSALSAGRPVLVLHFNGSTPVGNRMLIEMGGRPVGSAEELHREILALQKAAKSMSSQMTMFDNA